MEEDKPWYSLEWFQPEMFKTFHWENPYILYGLIIIPFILLIKHLILSKSGRILPVALNPRELKSSPISILRFLPGIFLLISLALILTALARPQHSNEKIEQWTEGIDIVIAVDVSQSMLGEDLLPNRLEAAKKMATRFIEGRLQDRIGIIVFSGEAFSLAPLTTDYKLLKSYIGEMQFDIIQTTGTAIGSALAVMTNRLRESNAKSKVGILLSDGESNAGNIDPETASDLASAYGITVYTILVGREGLVPYGKDAFGRPQMLENLVDEKIMRKIAAQTGGEFFRVNDNGALENVFDKIDKYEKAEIKESRYKNTKDFYYVYLRWAMIFFLVWMFLKSTFITNPISD